MDERRQPRSGFHAFCSTWTSFAFVFIIFFYIIGDVTFGWWHNAIWVWIIIGFSLLGAISTSIRFFIFASSRISQHPETRYYSENNVQEYIPESDSSLMPTRGEEESHKTKRFCKYCGVEITGSGEFCQNCGSPSQSE
ncbi:MAG: hypothetical protein ACTSSH_05825 [Candidatus Heimdallarchaeota archaeon]